MLDNLVNRAGITAIATSPYVMTHLRQDGDRIARAARRCRCRHRSVFWTVPLWGRRELFGAQRRQASTPDATPLSTGLRYRSCGSPMNSPISQGQRHCGQRSGPQRHAASMVLSPDTGGHPARLPRAVRRPGRGRPTTPAGRHVADCPRRQQCLARKPACSRLCARTCPKDLVQRLSRNRWIARRLAGSTPPTHSRAPSSISARTLKRLRRAPRFRLPRRCGRPPRRTCARASSGRSRTQVSRRPGPRGGRRLKHSSADADRPALASRNGCRFKSVLSERASSGPSATRSTDAGTRPASSLCQIHFRRHGRQLSGF